MVAGMLPSPKRIRRQCQEAAQGAEYVVGATGPEERAVPAIVLNNEDPHQKSSSQYRHRQSNPKRPTKTEIHHRGGHKEAAERRRDLPEASPEHRPLEWCR